MSVPSPPKPMPSAAATAAPEEEPPGRRPISRSHGLGGVPWCGFTPRPEKANSVMPVRPITTKPARRSRATAGASASAGGASRRTTEPAAVVCPASSKRSFTVTGMPA